MEDKLKEMKQQNDLSDIVLEKERSGGGTEKMKKILLYTASLILLFLIALVAMKLFNEAPQKEESNLAQIGNGMEQKSDESLDQLSRKLEDTNKLFQQEPIIDESAETDLKFEEMVRKLKAQDAAQSASEKGEAAEKAPEPKIAAKETHAKEKSSFDQKVEQITQKLSHAKKEAKDSLTLARKESPKAAPAEPKVIAPKVIHQSKAAHKLKPTATTHKQKQEITTVSRTVTQAPVQKLTTLSGYFIQVGATSNSFPDRRYLQKIKNAGYDYIVHSVIVKGRKIKKILIGPYASRSAAQRRLPDVKAKINPSAYLYRIQ